MTNFIKKCVLRGGNLTLTFGQACVRIPVLQLPRKGDVLISGKIYELSDPLLSHSDN